MPEGTLELSIGNGCRVDHLHRGGDQLRPALNRLVDRSLIELVELALELGKVVAHSPNPLLTFGAGGAAGGGNSPRNFRLRSEIFDVRTRSPAGPTHHAISGSTLDSISAMAARHCASVIFVLVSDPELTVTQRTNTHSIMQLPGWNFCPRRDDLTAVLAIPDPPRIVALLLSRTRGRARWEAAEGETLGITAGGRIGEAPRLTRTHVTGALMRAIPAASGKAG